MSPVSLVHHHRLEAQRHVERTSSVQTWISTHYHRCSTVGIHVTRLLQCFHLPRVALYS